MLHKDALDLITKIISSRNKSKLYFNSIMSSSQSDSNYDEDPLNSSITDDWKIPNFVFWVGKLKMKINKDICQVPWTILPYK